MASSLKFNFSSWGAQSLLNTLLHQDCGRHYQSLHCYHSLGFDVRCSTWASGNSHSHCPYYYISQFMFVLCCICLYYYYSMFACTMLYLFNCAVSVLCHICLYYGISGTMLYFLYCAASVCTMAYYAVFFVLCCIRLCCAISVCTVLYLVVLFHMCLYYAASFCTVLYLLVFCCIFLCCAKYVWTVPYLFELSHMSVYVSYHQPLGLFFNSVFH